MVILLLLVDFIYSVIFIFIKETIYNMLNFS